MHILPSAEADGEHGRNEQVRVLSLLRGCGGSLFGGELAVVAYTRCRRERPTCAGANADKGALSQDELGGPHGVQARSRVATAAVRTSSARSRQPGPDARWPASSPHLRNKSGFVTRPGFSSRARTLPLMFVD
jgi:hypothetical protein